MSSRPNNQFGTFVLRLSELPPELRALLPANLDGGFSEIVPPSAPHRSSSDPRVVVALSRVPEDVAQGPGTDIPDLALNGMIHSMSEQASMLEAEFMHLGVVELIDDAITLRSQVLSLTPDDHPEKYDRLGDLGVAYMYRSHRVDEPADTNKAIEYLTEAVRLTPEGHEDKLRLLNNLGGSHLHRFQEFGDLADLESGIEYQSQAISLTHDDDPARPVRLHNHGNAYFYRFQSLGELEDLDKAIECLSQAVSLTDEAHANRSGFLESLGTSYRCRFKRLGDLTDLEKAIELHTRAVRLTPDDRSSKPGLLGNLGDSYMCRFERLGELEDIHKSIEYQSQAEKLTPPDHANRAHLLSGLGSAYRSRFQSIGGLEDIDNAVKCHTEAASLTPDGHIQKPKCLTHLGNAYQSRFARLGEASDLDKAIQFQSEGLMLVSDHSTDRADMLTALANSLQIRFQHGGGLSDIELAIVYQGAAILLTPDDHPYKAGQLSNLGNSFTFRFRLLGQLPDVDNAIQCQTQAVTLTPDNHPDKAGHLGNLGASYGRRFERLGELSDIDEAIKCNSQALILTPDGHNRKLVTFNNLAVAYQRRYEVSGRSTDAEAAHQFFQQAAQHFITDPEVQFWCAREWAKFSTLIGASPLQAYQRTMELVPQLVWLGMTIDRRYTVLRDLDDFSTEAASCAISLKSYDRALEWLEEGRSVVWNQILQLRKPIDDLAAADPALAERLQDVSRQLEREGSGSTSRSEPEAQNHRHLANEWNRLLEQARQLPGFGDFMRPYKADVLTRAAKDGPVIVINVHRTRCDALIIRPEQNDVVVVALERFSPKKATEAQAKLLSLIGHGAARVGGFRRSRAAREPEEEFKAMLSSLWWDVVKPVLDYLGYSRTQSIDKLPHVTWCTTGALSFLPLHAAGCYDGSNPSAMDLVVSSYTPTLNALLASTSTPPVPSSRSGVLAVGQESTKGFAYLPHTVRELEAVREHVSGTRYLQLNDASATVGAVLDAMADYSCVHLACHASQNIADPAQSAFHLHDGDLTLAEITKRSFKDKGLAFLSACQTATGDDELPDEAVHLAAGMLMAGYPSVIATMWEINDEDAPGIAQHVYSDVLKDGDIDFAGASRSLHKAVVALREKIGENSFERWMPFIHIGS